MILEVIGYAAAAALVASGLRHFFRKREEARKPAEVHTTRNGDRLSDWEYEQFHSGFCPDCNQPSLTEGPHGGMSVNYKCVVCGSMFNDMGPFGIDRISVAMPELMGLQERSRA